MVREMAVSFKVEWISASFLPKVIATYDQEKIGFNYRMACLEAMSAVMPPANKEVITN